MQHKTDLRVIKTKANIKKVFIELLNQKEFDKITVQDILDHALINRSTFYKYYADKYDLAEQLVDEVINDTSLFINERFIATKGEVFFSTIKRIYEHFYERRDVILALLRIKTDKINLSGTFQTLLKEGYISHIKTKGSHESASLLDYHATVYASFVFTTLNWLLFSGNKSDIDKITRDFNSMFFNKIFFTDFKTSDIVKN
jgi:AcrR family transcriptional regulator